MLKRIAVFASGSGTNFQALIDAIDSGEIDSGYIDILIASKADIYAIERAKAHDIEYRVYDKADFKSLEEMYTELSKLLKAKSIDLIVLAGYLTIITPELIKEYENRIINIHPSLIPKYCGMGYYGIKVHQAVIAGKEKESGATVHFVDEGADTGEIIMQEKVPVLPDDTPETLAARVLELEHKLLPKAVKYICNKI